MTINIPISPEEKAKRKSMNWVLIPGSIVLGIIIGVAASPPADGAETAREATPAPTVTVTENASDSGDSAALEADLADAEAAIADCQARDLQIRAATDVVLDAFLRQTDLTVLAATFGATDEVVAEQDAITAQIDDATAMLDGLPDC